MTGAAGTPPPRHESGQQSLVRRLGAVRAALERHIGRQSGPSDPEEAADGPGGAGGPAALDDLCGVFRLSPFECDVLLLCAGMELESTFAGLCAAAQGDPSRPYPTFSLALAALPQPHWSALTSAAPLRRHRLVEVGDGPALTQSPLRIDERILHCLVGLNGWDERLRGLVDPVPDEGALAPSHQALADRIAAIWRGAGTVPPVIQLCGPERVSRRRVAAAACGRIGLGLGLLAAETLPAVPQEMETLLGIWGREAVLTGSALLLEADEAGESARPALARAVERAAGFVVLSGADRQPVRGRPVVTLEVGNPTRAEQRALWGLSLGTCAASLEGQIEQIATQFDVSDLTIRSAGAEALGRGAGDAPAALGRALWDACRVSSRPRLDDLAQRIEPAADWDDLVLPEAPRLVLRDIAAHVRRRGVVYHQWGFASQGERGLGISALFAGPSGVGKTMAAEVLARALDLDLYRIDLSAVVSKYIGESEKNLRRVFDAAEGGGAILLFDEADALFGKRTETKDSHDRYANQEVAYLLQRMESYRGLAILTTNLRSSLDTAFLRRLRYAVQFPFPDAAQRAEIWRRVFPPAAPTEGLDPEKLAQLGVAGGHIRSIALNAAFLAADAGEPIRPAHILRAAQSECAKLERPLTDAETAGWL